MEKTQKKILKEQFCLKKDENLPENKEKTPISEDAYAVASIVENGLNEIFEKMEHIRRNIIK